MVYEQLSFFDLILDEYKIKKPVRLIECFAGIGSQHQALEELGVDYELWKICEWAVPSILAYNEIHFQDHKDYSQGLTREECQKAIQGVSMDYNRPLTEKELSRKSESWIRQVYNSVKATHNLIDISQVKGKDLEIKDTDKYTYLLTYSFPCQDLSLAGKGKGMKKNSGTRSGLLWQVERLLDECAKFNELPHILVMENVPQVIGVKSIKDFQEWEQKLESLGYSNFVEILNSKDYGIPQNRQRCFMVSILGEHNYKFPRKIKLENRLKDLLEKEVDEKYFLSKKMIQGMMNTNFESYKLENKIQNPEGVVDTIIARFEGTPMCIKYPNATKQGYLFANEGDGLDIGARMLSHRETVQKGMAQTLKTSCEVGTFGSDLRIRKLTGKECYRLMGFNDKACDNARKVISKSMIYHTAGDSIVVQVLMGIFGKLFFENEEVEKKIRESIERLKV